MESFADWKAAIQLDESRTTKQHADRVAAKITAAGGVVNKHKDGGEHGEHKFHHTSPDGDRWVTTVKGETTTTRPATRGEAVHFTPTAATAKPVVPPVVAPAAKPAAKKEEKKTPKK